MALEGNLQVLSLPEILQMIALQRKTGILTVQGEADIVAVSFLNGDVVSADALNRTVEESLGESLAARGVVSREDFAALAAEQQSGAGRLVELLVKRGLVERDQLLETLHEETCQMVLALLRWREGDFKFYGGEEVSYEDGFDPIHVDELLIRAVAEGAIERQTEVTEATRFAAPASAAESTAPAPADPEPAPAPISPPPPPARPRLVPPVTAAAAGPRPAPAP